MASVKVTEVEKAIVLDAGASVILTHTPGADGADTVCARAELSDVEDFLTARAKMIVDDTLSVNGAAAEAQAAAAAIGAAMDAAAKRAIRDDDADWALVRNAVKAGLGPTMYPVGTLLNHHRAIGAEAVVRNGQITVTLDEGQFLRRVKRTNRAVVAFRYDGRWRMDGEICDPAWYGLTISGTPEKGDLIDVALERVKMVWRVVGHDHHDVVSGAAHTMTLETATVVGDLENVTSIEPCARQAFYTAESEMAAGTYHYTVKTTVSQWSAGTYQFTTTKSHPKGALFVFSENVGTAMTSVKVNVYDAWDGDVTETASISSGSGGTDLGKLADELNHPHRAGNGSNNYAQGAIRRWLNSDADPAEWFSPTTVWDRPTQVAALTDGQNAGFMRGLGAAFIGALETARVPCLTNATYETDSADGTEYAINTVYYVEDRVFLLSRAEIWGEGRSSTLIDGTQLKWYETDRGPRMDEGGTGRSAWTRTPQTTAYQSYYINNTTGASAGGTAGSRYRVTAAVVV